MNAPFLSVNLSPNKTSNISCLRSSILDKGKDLFPILNSIVVVSKLIWLGLVGLPLNLKYNIFFKKVSYPWFSFPALAVPDLAIKSLAKAFITLNTLLACLSVRVLLFAKSNKSPYLIKVVPLGNLCVSPSCTIFSSTTTSNNPPCLAIISSPFGPSISDMWLSSYTPLTLGWFGIPLDIANG